MIKWAKVQYVLAWMDKFATASAIRYYWPAILSILPPDSNRVSAELSERHREPVGISRVMPLIRETAGYVASALLIPEDVEKPKPLLELRIIIGTYVRLVDGTTVLADGDAVSVPSFTVSIG
jgi:hypothetical protein